MEIIFDISKDELPIFLAEVDEHLQTLDNSLLRLQREEYNAELLQTVFRSAHTIKGMAGMIGHRRMTDLTHALETVLDGVRKNSILISSQLINFCLETVDCLRCLRDEVETSQSSSVDIGELVCSLKQLTEDDEEELTESIRNSTVFEVDTSNSRGAVLQIRAKIDTNSMASAARALQLIMSLQDLGEIKSVKPSLEEIDTATSVADFAAEVLTDQPFEKVSAALIQISGIEEIAIDGKLVLSKGEVVSTRKEKVRSEQSVGPEKPEKFASVYAQTDDSSASQQSRERRITDPVGRRISDLTFRMNVEHMDKLMNLVGELIIDRNHLKQIHSRLTRLNSNYDQISETVLHLGQIADQLQEEVMGMRMLPIGNIFNKFPRMVHDMARKVGKQINVVIHGEDTEMDRLMIEEIYDPLIHLVRNSVDHGVEPSAKRLAAGKAAYGTITLSARHEHGRIILTVEDDGGGIDCEKLRSSAVQKGLISEEEAAALTEEQIVDLMFMPGLSTAEKATEFSGRGVGLDIVKTNIQHVNGTIQVRTSHGHGTQFEIALPLTLAIVPSLLVNVQSSIFAIPIVMITETLRLEESEIKYICQKPVILLRGNVLTLIRLSDVFNIPQREAKRGYPFAVVIQSGKQQIGLIVDALIGEEEVVVKPLGAFIGDVPGISSAAILGSGQVALIVDIFNLFKLVGI